MCHHITKPQTEKMTLSFAPSRGIHFPGDHPPAPEIACLLVCVLLHMYYHRRCFRHTLFQYMCIITLIYCTWNLFNKKELQDFCALLCNSCPWIFLITCAHLDLGLRTKPPAELLKSEHSATLGTRLEHYPLWQCIMSGIKGLLLLR